jgi:hypothetical protein
MTLTHKVEKFGFIGHIFTEDGCAFNGFVFNSWRRIICSSYNYQGISFYIGDSTHVAIW